MPVDQRGTLDERMSRAINFQKVLREFFRFFE
jgi:hypothetical protein